MPRTPRARHIRYSRHSRVRYRERLIDFLAARAVDLEDTGAALSFSVTDVAYAAATLTLTGNALDGETVTIGSRVYTFQDTLTDEDGNVHIGASADASLTNLINAINASGGTSGTDYAESTTAHPDVEAAAGDGDTMDVSHLIGGSAGNDIAVSTDVEDGSWGEDVVALSGGTDSINLTITTHGLAVGEGPFLATSDEDLPVGMTGDQLYWVKDVVDANTVVLTTRRSSYALMLLTEGSGTLQTVKAESEAAILEYLKQNPYEVVRDADDVDDL